MTDKVFVWLHEFKSQSTISYFIANAETVELARSKILQKVKDIKDTTTDCVYSSEGVDYRYKSSPLGASDGILHLGAPYSMTTEEVCHMDAEVTNTLSKDPLIISPSDFVGFVTAKG